MRPQTNKANIRDERHRQRNKRTRLEKMFKKWSNPNNTTKIARTARAIDPHEVYAIRDWPNDFARLIDIPIRERTMSHTHLPFMYREGDTVRVSPKLVDCWLNFFPKKPEPTVPTAKDIQELAGVAC